MATTGRVSGISGNITFAGNTFHVTSWEGEVNAEALEVTDSSSGSYREYIEGLVSGTVTADFNFDTTNLPHNSSVGLTRGVTATFVGNIGAASKTLQGSVIVTQLRYRNPIDGVSGGSLSGNFSGSITEPT